MSLHDIIERFSLVSGFDRQETSRYLVLIRDCAGMFEDRIGTQLSDSDRRRLAHACAVFAYYRICCMARDGGIQSFKAGDVQIVSDDDCAAAERMWNTERGMIADLVSFDNGFAFRSVRV